MTESRPAKGEDKSFGTLFNELSSMVVTYVKEQTIEPIKGLGRYVAFGVAGALLVAIGGVTLTLATVRLVQAETTPHLRGDWSWVPYAGGIVVAGVGAVWAVTRISKSERGK